MAMKTINGVKRQYTIEGKNAANYVTDRVNKMH